MANDGQIVFEVTADGKHAIADIKEITRAIQQETGKWDDAAGKSANSINNQFSSMLKKLVAGFSAAKIVDVLKNVGSAAIDAASDLAEVQNVVDVTFGDNANQIERWAKGAADQFGLTETQAKRFSSTMGAMLKSSGMAGEEIVKMSTDLSGLAADMASFYNMDFDTAFQKIRSGISGETEPLKQLGINMSVANLEAFALSKGLDKAFSEMTQGEQTMLRYQYLMQATADAQGDFSRTSDEYANSTRRLESNVESLKTKLGEFLLGPATDFTNWANNFLTSLMPDESKRTVLDDFADINLDTAGKLAELQKTAEEARLLTDELEKIGGEKTSKAGGKVQQLVDDLSGISFDQGKTAALKSFISVLGQNIDIISSIQGSTADEAKTWLETLAAGANSLEDGDAEGWAALLNSLREGLPGFENTDVGSSFFEQLGAGFESIEGKASVLEWALDALGNKTDRTAQEQALWLETCRRLVQTIPGLSSIINTETGEIQGGTDAVKEYIKAWEDGQEKLILMGALEQKRTALSTRFADLPGLELDMVVAESRVRKSYEQLQKIYNKYGLKLGFNQDGSVYRNFSDAPGMTKEARDELTRETDYFEQLYKEAQEAHDAYQLQADALKEAEGALDEYEKTIEDKYPDAVEEAKEATEEWSDEVKTNATNAVNAAKTALDDLSNYVAEFRANVKNSVDGVVKGFGSIVLPAQEVKTKISELEQQVKDGTKSAEDAEKELKSLQNQLDQYTTTGMKSGLESQMAFMDEYLNNLQKAQEIGLSNELLASLSDGSVESAQYLASLVEDEAGAREVDALYKQVQGKKQELTDALTDQQLTVDQTYQDLAAKAKEAVAALDLEGEAATNSGKTVAGLAQGISSHVSDVQTAVDSILEQLNRLNGWGISIDLGGFGNIQFTTNTGADGAGRFGIDYVPFDNYVARLHEGERVLTAQENQVWNMLQGAGLGNLDYENLGTVMRDNIQPGGNVYLDGKTVGQVISAQQGKSYRTLKRSGWQS